MIESHRLLIELGWCLEYENEPEIPAQIRHQLDGLI